MHLININDIFLPTILAETELDHEFGLMFVNQPESMTFRYSEARIANFWMKCTPEPLDILFCHDNKIKKIAHGTPYSLELICSDEICDMVVELPAGTSERLGFVEGSDVRMISDR